MCTSVVGSNKRELKVTKSFSCRLCGTTLFTGIAFSVYIFCRIFIGSTQYFQWATAESSVWEVEFCMIVPYSSKNFLHPEHKLKFAKWQQPRRVMATTHKHSFPGPSLFLTETTWQTLGFRIGRKKEISPVLTKCGQIPHKNWVTMVWMFRTWAQWPLMELL